jgi:hypothetical protein
MEPMEDYLSRVLYNAPTNYNRGVYDTKERLKKLIKQKQIEDMRESLGGNRGIHLPNEE